MRELTQEEERELCRRRDRFESFLMERMPVMADFAEALELDNPSMIVADPERYLPSVDEFMRNKVVEVDDRAWIVTRLGYFIGEVLIQRLGGCWLLNEIPDSRHFSRYVAGQFTGVSNRNAMFDPFEVASVFVEQQPERGLEQMVAEVEKELRAA